MPLECAILEGSPQPRSICPYCGDYPFEALERGYYQREKLDEHGKRQHYCLVICSECNQLVGYESPPWNSKAWQQVSEADKLQRQSESLMTISVSVFVFLIGALLLAGWMALFV